LQSTNLCCHPQLLRIRSSRRPSKRKYVNVHSLSPHSLTHRFNPSAESVWATSVPSRRGYSISRPHPSLKPAVLEFSLMLRRR
jgi:hypothetical protein